MINTQLKPTRAEETKGDFIYRIITEKGEYYEGEPVHLYAELEYVGIVMKSLSIMQLHHFIFR